MKIRRKRWTKEELDFLKFAYQNDRYTVYKISQLLNRTEDSVRRKSTELKLKRPRDDSQGGYKRCSKCNEILSVEFFYNDPTGRNGLRSYCKFCERECCKRYREKRKLKKLQAINSSKDTQ